MRRIIKHKEPKALAQWKTANKRTPQNLIYSGGSFPSEAVRQALLLEQFHLCAYTLRRLKTVEECQTEGQGTNFSCHIEHIYPRANHAQRGIDYTNMLACWPASALQDTACDYGAFKKAAYDPATKMFISPLAVNAQKHFRYLPNGKVKPLTDEADATIKALNLNAHVLVNNREAVIKGRLKLRGKEISAAQARRVAEQMDIPDNRNCLPEYCEAIKHAAEQHARRYENRAQRIKAKH